MLCSGETLYKVLQTGTVLGTFWIVVLAKITGYTGVADLMADTIWYIYTLVYWIRTLFIFDPKKHICFREQVLCRGETLYKVLQTGTVLALIGSLSWYSGLRIYCWILFGIKFIEWEPFSYLTQNTHICFRAWILCSGKNLIQGPAKWNSTSPFRVFVLAKMMDTLGTYIP
jgi:hypothetical protein